MPKTPTDAEKLAAAEAMVRDGLEQAKSARLPSADAAVAVLGGAEALALLDLLRPAIEASIDDVTRPLGQAGTEGTRQMMQRVVTSLEQGLAAAQARQASLLPAEAPAPEIDPA